MRLDTHALPRGTHSLRRLVSAASLRETAVTVLLALYFPLLFVAVVGLPVVLAGQFGLPLAQAIQSSFLLGALGYLFGFRVLFQ